MSETRGLSINVTIELIEELLKKHVKNVPNDIRFAGVEREWYHNSLRFYFKSKNFPIVEGQLKLNVVTGQIEAKADEHGKLIGLTLNWKDPDKKEKNE